MNPSPHVIVGWMLLALCAVGLIWTVDHYRAWFRDQLAYGWTFTVAYVRDGQPEQRTLNEYADDLDFADGLNVAEAVAAVPELDLDGTQPFAAVFHDDAPPVAVPTLVLDDGSFAGLSGTIPTDVPRPGSTFDRNPAGGNRRTAEPGYLDLPGSDAARLAQSHPTVSAAGPGQPFHPHAGPPAWRPQHAKTTWVDELITSALGAPTVEIYMWNWQQRHRLAVTA